MTGSDYLAYVMSETNVEQAVSEGVDETSIREWCLEKVSQVFRRGPREVLFEAYVAYVRRG